MSSGPLLYLRLDELAGGTARDSSGNALDAAALGAARVVADDTFGGVLELSGGEDGLQLPAGAVPAGAELSVCVWLYGGSALPDDSSVLQAVDGAGVVTVDVRVPDGDGTVRWDHGNDGGGTDRLRVTPGNAGDVGGSWAHWAFVRDADGTMRIYREGVQYGEPSTGNARTRTAAARVSAGRNGGAGWVGRMAHLRVYDRAVDANEIARMREDDRTAQSSFRRTYPFDLYLHDGQDQEVLYITDAVEGKPLHVEIANQSGLNVRLLTPADPTAGPQNHHFALRFRPGTLSAASLGAAQDKLDAALQPSGWRGNAGQDADGSAVLYFLHPAGLTLEAGKTLGFVFPHASADAGGGARGTRVELRFGQLTFADGGDAAVTGRRLAHLNVVNHQGEREIPLHAGFVGNDVVLNDGKTLTTLILRIANTLSDGSISFTGEGGDAPSRLVVAFDAQAPGETRDWALGLASEVLGITPTVTTVRGAVREGWTVHPEPGSPEWTATSPADTALAAGEWIEIALDGVSSTLPSGPATMYVRYQNIPGYWDGQLTAPLEKGVVVQQGGFVGMGTAAPQEALHVTGNVRVDGGVIRSATSISLHPDVDGTGDGFVRFLKVDGSEAMRVATDGSVGIGTLSPTDALHVTGNLRVDGGQIRSLNCISLKPDIDATGDGFVQIVRPDGGESMRVTSAGSVGIGTNAPQQMLHVTGNVRADGGQFMSWGAIQLRPDVDQTGDGDVRIVSNGGVEVLRISTNGATGRLGGTITKGVGFTASTSALKGHSSGGWSTSEIDGEGIRIEGTSRGVLGVSGADVLCWKAGHVFIKGTLWAYEKWFRVPHPLLPGRDLVHGCLEGPENAVYYRGTARLREGRAIVHLPDYFEALTVAGGRTVQLTPRGRVPFVLSHDGVADGRFEVFGSIDEGEFDWEVRAARADVAPLPTDLPAA